MSDDTCTYDCSAQPASLAPYSDISGIGVILSYTTTATLVVFITLLGYLWVYDEQQYPFRTAERPDPPVGWKPNPIDVLFLKVTRRWLPSKRLLPQRVQKNWSSQRLQALFQKCVLNMSDLQVLTGLSILISGFAQLRCGLSAYHWQILVYLAWFSSLTHLGCLTFARNHLYNHPGQRLWRLAAMLIVIIMLVVALVPTAYFNWIDCNADETVKCAAAPQSYTICYYGHPHPIASYYQSGFSGTMISTVLSCLLLVIGYTTRVVRLVKTLSVTYVPQLRSSISQRARKALQRVYERHDIPNNARSTGKLLVYHTLLANFIVLRISVDIYTSMLMEVWWLIFGLAWGLVHLIQTLQMSPLGVGKGSWTFGQVVPLVLLAAPVLSLAEFFFDDEVESENPDPSIGHDKPPSPPSDVVDVATHSPEPTAATEGSAIFQHPQRVETLEIADNLHNVPLEGLRNDPECDFYQDTEWGPWVALYIICVVAMVSICVVTYTALKVNMAVWFFQPAPELWWTYFAFSIPWTLWNFVLWIMIVDDHDQRTIDNYAVPLSKVAVRAGLVVLFLFQMLCFGIGLPNTVGDLSILSLSPSTWLWAVVPWWTYLVVVAVKIGTRRQTLIVLAVGVITGSALACWLPVAIALYGGFFSI